MTAVHASGFGNDCSKSVIRRYPQNDRFFRHNPPLDPPASAHPPHKLLRKTRT
jgi:hypothetical protein